MNIRGGFLPFLTILSVLALLYFAKTVLMPFALAMLLSFLLSPLVDHLQRWHFSRVAAVSVVTFFVLILVGVLTWVVFTQFLHVAQELPRYQNNLRTKLAALKSPVGPGLERTWETIEQLSQELTDTGADLPKAVEVEVREPRPSAIEMIRTMSAPIIKPLGTAAVVIVFVVFMLLKREELRDKLIRLIGPERVTVTTQAFDDATTRVSRFLLMQTLINGGQGLVVGILLYFIGVPNAGLWGILTAIIRFIPYLGPWLAALMPITLSIIVFDSWTQPLITISMFICVELISNNIMEPWLLGAYTGTSSMALIVAAVFWTWLWGAIGLLLSVPLTVCLAVLGKYIPHLRFLHILLSDEPVLSPSERFYQRLLAGDVHEADVVLQEELKQHSVEEISETLLLPALRMVEKDLQMGSLDEHRYEFVIEKMQDVVSTMDAPAGKANASLAQSGLVLCFAGRDAADETASMIFAVLLRTKGIDARWISAETLAGELVELVEEKQPAAICISALPPSAVTHAKYLCKRLRARFPKLLLLVGLWGATGELEKAAEILTQAGADRVVRTLREGVGQVQQWIAQDFELEV